MTFWPEIPRPSATMKISSAIQSTPCLQEVFILSLPLAIVRTDMFHNFITDCLFLLSAFEVQACNRQSKPTWLETDSTCPLRHVIDKSYGCINTNPLREQIQVSRAKRQSSVSWNFNRMSKTETKQKWSSKFQE